MAGTKRKRETLNVLCFSISMCYTLVKSSGDIKALPAKHIEVRVLKHGMLNDTQNVPCFSISMCYILVWCLGNILSVYNISILIHYQYQLKDRYMIMY